jgi:hypothetical protein
LRFGFKQRCAQQCHLLGAEFAFHQSSISTVSCA